MQSKGGDSVIHRNAHYVCRQNTADEDAFYVSKVWWFVFIWADLAVHF